MTLRHFPGNNPCPDCEGDMYDPETGYCAVCEDDLELYRITAVDGPTMATSPKRFVEALVSRRQVGTKVLELLPDAAFVIVKAAT
jgi:hypothetical protein